MKLSTCSKNLVILQVYLHFTEIKILIKKYYLIDASFI